MGLSDLLWLFFVFAALQPMLRQRVQVLMRARKIAQLQLKRGTRVITLVHRQETMRLLGFPLMRYIDMDDSEAVVRAIHEMESSTPIDIVLHTPGGLVLASLQIARALKAHKGKVTVFVPHFAMSGGTLIALAHRGGFMRPDGTVPRLHRALMADSGAAMIGAAIGTSTTTSYIESASGINSGGRTGLTALTVAVLFLLALFIAPLAGSIPPYATAPALLYVAILMARGLAEIEWDDITEAAPAVITAIAMPFTFSIAEGIAFGFISYAGIKLAAGRYRDIHPAVGILAVLFVIKYLYIK